MAFAVEANKLNLLLCGGVTADRRRPIAACSQEVSGGGKKKECTLTLDGLNMQLCASCPCPSDKPGCAVADKCRGSVETCKHGCTWAFTEGTGATDDDSPWGIVFLFLFVISGARPCANTHKPRATTDHATAGQPNWLTKSPAPPSPAGSTYVVGGVVWGKHKGLPGHPHNRRCASPPRESPAELQQLKAGC